MAESQVQEMNELIRIACGPRSIAEFANDCGISRAHIFRMKNGVIPSRKLCKRIAEDEYVKQLGLTCEQIYKAAGYTNSSDIDEARMFEELTTNNGYETIDLGIITQKLMESSFNPKLLPVGNNQDVNFAFMVKKGRKNITWKFIVSVDDIQDAKSQKRVNAYYYNFGLIASLMPKDDEQYSLIVHNESDFNQLSRVADLGLIKGRVSIILIDVDLERIVKEDFIGPSRCFISLIDKEM